jgi:hypothetical protein
LNPELGADTELGQMCTRYLLHKGCSPFASFSNPWCDLIAVLECEKASQHIVKVGSC